MCQVLEVSRSGYYCWIQRPESTRSKEDKVLIDQINNVFISSRRTYGSPRIVQTLRKEGYKIGRNRVSRLMKIAGVAAKTKRKYKATTNSKHNLPVAENILNRQFAADKENKAWVSDITYIWTDEGWLYLATVLNLSNRKIVGWAMDSAMTKDLVISALKQAISRYRPVAGTIHHSDRGSQYASLDYQALLKENIFVVSMSRKGNCYDNACMESFNGTIKTELIYGERFKTRTEAKAAIFEYIEVFYNRLRIHSSLNYQSPEEYEKANKVA
jgi:transposase InsO family protein